MGRVIGKIYARHFMAAASNDFFICSTSTAHTTGKIDWRRGDIPAVCVN